MHSFWSLVKYRLLISKKKLFSNSFAENFFKQDLPISLEKKMIPSFSLPLFSILFFPWSIPLLKEKWNKENDTKHAFNWTISFFILLNDLILGIFYDCLRVKSVVFRKQSVCHLRMALTLKMKRSISIIDEEIHRHHHCQYPNRQFFSKPLNNIGSMGLHLQLVSMNCYNVLFAPILCTLLFIRLFFFFLTIGSFWFCVCICVWM